MNYFCYLGCSILTEEVCSLLPTVDSVIDLRMLPSGFHEQPGVFNKLLQAEINRVEEWAEIRKNSVETVRDYDAVLLGFGLCSEAVVGLRSSRYPLVIPRAHDCITLLLGSKERYLKYFSQEPASFWYSCGWINRMLPPGKEREDRLSRVYLERYGVANAEILMEEEKKWQLKYNKATLIKWDLPKNEQLQDYTRNSATYLGWEYQDLPGDPGLLYEFLSGHWDEERFLIVKPGAVVAASYDESIFSSKKLEG